MGRIKAYARIYIALSTMPDKPAVELTWVELSVAERIIRVTDQLHQCLQSWERSERQEIDI